MKSNILPLKNEKLRAFHVKKNKIYNPSTLKKQINPHFFEDLTRKLNKAQLMKFITTKPEHLHLYLVAEFYRKAIIAIDNKSFKTKVFCTLFIISAQFLADEFGLNNSGVSVFTYLDCNSNIEITHWYRLKRPDYTQTFKLGSP